MRVKVSEIPPTGLTVEDEIPPEEMEVREASFAIDHPVRVRLFLEIIDNVFVARGSFETDVTCTCDRCLKNFTKAVSNSEYLFGEDLESVVDETIDLTEGVREDILLELPLKMLCSDACKGICPQCGADLNVEKCSCEPRTGLTPFSELDNLI